MANKDRSAVQSGLDDLLGNVIKSDQKTAGRSRTAMGLAGEPSPEAVHSDITPDSDVIDSSDIMTIRHYDNKTDGQTNIQSDKQTDELEANLSPKLKEGPKRRSTKTSTSESTSIEHRHEEAATMAQGATMTVTLRIPAPMNDWLDEYVHRSWPNKVKKQQLVIEALQMLFVRRGRPGEEIIETDLLPEKKK